MILDFTTARTQTLRGQLAAAVKSVRSWGCDPDREAIADVATYVADPSSPGRWSQGRRTLAVEVGNVRSLSSAWEEMAAVGDCNPHVEHAVFGMVSWSGPGFVTTVDYLLYEARLVLATLGLRRHKYAVEVYEVGAARIARIITSRVNHRTGWVVESPWFDLAEGQIGNACAKPLANVASRVADTEPGVPS